MTLTATAISGLVIRLPEERWQHILEIGRVLVVVYKETSKNDGFVITAFPTRRLNSLTIYDSSC